MNKTRNYNKSDIVNSLHKSFKGLRPKDINMIIDLIIKYLANSLKENRKIEIRDFAVFETRLYAPKIGFNPASRKELHIPASKNILFRPSQKLIKKELQNVI